MLFSKDYGNIKKVFHFLTFTALGAAFKWNFPSISHTFFFGCSGLVSFFLVWFFCLFVCFSCCFFSLSRSCKDKDKTFLHRESLQTISMGIILA